MEVDSIMLLNQIFPFTIDTLLIICTLFILILSVFLLLEVLAALFPHRHRSQGVSTQDRKLAILVPAHNEEVCLRGTLETLQTQLKLDKSLASTEICLVVVADNCTDATAEIAQEMGATVIERQDTVRVGKGFALDYGLRSLVTDPPDVVVLIDADCQVQAGAIGKLTQQVLATGRPAQATYLMAKPSLSRAKDSVSVFAFMMKNLVRPLGLSRLGFPCLLTGTGMAFPWAAIRSVNLASSDLVEDMKLSLDLTIAGHAPLYCPGALVVGSLPKQNHAACSQRTRWEHGHLQAISTYVPKLIQAAIEKRSLAAIVLAAELCVPPLSLFVMLWLAFSITAVVWGLLTAVWIPAILAVVAGTLLATGILLAWVKFGYDVLPLTELLSIPFYILWKVPVYFKFLVCPQKTWVRTERDELPVASTQKLVLVAKALEE
jgi:cellulose synthase/poly-beta-1,6-N-acetylglucosamine synthase-like glycosyltransferase